MKLFGLPHSIEVKSALIRYAHNVVDLNSDWTLQEYCAATKGQVTAVGRITVADLE